ncbi:MAG: MBOAT family O-acyltransferase [Muribaculaceae bacterium]
MFDNIVSDIGRRASEMRDAVITAVEQSDIAGSLRDLLSFDRANPLLFNSGLFLFLFLGFLLVYMAVRRWNNVKMVVVILFSLYFYYKSSAMYCFILLGVAVSDYVLGRVMGALGSKAWQKCVIALNVTVNVGMLVYFKYFNLLAETFANITSTRFDPLDIVLPAGISFFTFRSISYLVDIYRGDIAPARNFLQYVFYLTFFPPLLAGPVVRAKDMLPQVAANPVVTRAMVSEGLFLIMAGLIKKVVIADYISGNFVDRIFDNPALYTGFENVMGAFGFALQLYCDFSGYSDMAIGVALLMGYRFKDNFNSPYKSQSPTEFWKRWHISLSSWLMDYVYIPLGGNRRGRARQHLNLMTTMLIGGLWHGASWMYLLWGGYNGLLLVGHKLMKNIKVLPRKLSESLAAKGVRILFTFVLIVIGFTFFRANSLQDIGDMYTAITTNFHADVAPQFITGYTMIAVAIAAGFILHFMPSAVKRGLKRAYAWMPLVLQALILATVIFLVIQTRQSDLVPFIYFKY